jgi:hypothetical protein
MLLVNRGDGAALSLFPLLCASAVVDVRRAGLTSKGWLSIRQRPPASRESAGPVTR